MKNKSKWMVGITATVLVILFAVILYLFMSDSAITKSDVLEALAEQSADFCHGDVQISMEASYRDWGTALDWSFYADTLYDFQPDTRALHRSTSGTTTFSEAEIAFAEESYVIPDGNTFTKYENDNHNTYGWTKEINTDAGELPFDYDALLAAFSGETAGFTSTETTYLLSVSLAEDELEAVIGESKDLLDIGLDTIEASFDSSMYQAVVELEAQKETNAIVKVSVTMQQGLKSTFATAGRELVDEGSMSIVYRPRREVQEEIHLPEEVQDDARTMEEIQKLETAEYEPENELSVRGKYALYNDGATMAVGINKPSGLMLSYEDYYFMSFSDFELYYEIKYRIKEKKTIEEYMDAFIAEKITGIEGNELLERKEPGQFTTGDWDVSYGSIEILSGGMNMRQHIGCADIGTDSEGKEWCLYVEAFEIPVNGRYRYSAESALKKAYRAARK